MCVCVCVCVQWFGWFMGTHLYNDMDMIKVWQCEGGYEVMVLKLWLRCAADPFSSNSHVCTYTHPSIYCTLAPAVCLSLPHLYCLSTNLFHSFHLDLCVWIQFLTGLRHLKITLLSLSVLFTRSLSFFLFLSILSLSLLLLKASIWPSKAIMTAVVRLDEEPEQNSRTNAVCFIYFKTDLEERKNCRF